ncbi:acyltransferase family protein [Butyrivibrio sp. VCB2006]|uniref:acyltransferase family protein n=1 Tax=Butyrivibrio sp. VCB2006 TaxID=1280679 RepID=UPI0004029F72|nr:acyltransferase [Butyrivibrio sp. VCB2006]
MNKRYNFMNVLRVLSMLFIVFYHMLITLYIDGIRQLESISFLFENANMHIAKIGVGLFFMLSGAGLMLSSHGDDFSALKFYKKRFFKILIPFYIVYFFYFVFLVTIGEMNLSNPFGDKELKPYSFIFTIFGMDAYLENFGVPTCSLGIGEWFLGCLILIYLLFPVLRLSMLTSRKIAMITSTIYFAFICIFYFYVPAFVFVNPYMNMALKIYDFILGMNLVLTIKKRRKITPFICAAILLFFILYPTKMAGTEDFQIPIQCLCIYIIFEALEKIFEKVPKVMNIIVILAAYSYEYFLVHHVVIIHMTKLGMNKAFGNLQIVLLFLGEIVLTTVLAILLKKFTGIIYEVIPHKKSDNPQVG